MLLATTPGAILELQKRFIEEYMDALFNGTMNLVQAIYATADRGHRFDPTVEEIS